MLDRFFHPPNKCSKVRVAISQKFYCREEAWAMQKLFIKKEKKKRIGKKWTSVRDIKNNGHLDAHLKNEREMTKITYVLLQKCFQVSKERYVFKEQSRIRLATTYIHTHSHLDLIV